MSLIQLQYDVIACARIGMHMSPKYKNFKKFAIFWLVETMNPNQEPTEEGLWCYINYFSNAANICGAINK